MKGRMMPLPGSDESVEEHIEEWKELYPHSCRTTCPGFPNNTVLPSVAEEIEDVLAESPANRISPIPSPATTTNPLPQPRRSPRLATISTNHLFSPVASTTLSPLFGDIDLENLSSNPRPISPQEAVLVQEFTMPDRPAVLEDTTTTYIPTGDINFTTLQEFTDHLAATRTPIPGANSLFISGSSVSEAAQALVLAIKGTGRSQTAEFSESDLVRGSQNQRLALRTLFQHHMWYFNAYVCNLFYVS
jgi:hypothetical protein